MDSLPNFITHGDFKNQYYVFHYPLQTGLLEAA